MPPATFESIDQIFPGVAFNPNLRLNGAGACSLQQLQQSAFTTSLVGMTAGVGGAALALSAFAAATPLVLPLCSCGCVANPHAVASLLFLLGHIQV